MSAVKDMRRAPRDDFDTPVMYSQIGTTSFKHADMHNFSEGGMYFESKVPMSPGSDLSVKTMNFRSANKCTVKWCKELEDADTGKYGIGLECEI